MPLFEYTCKKCVKSFEILQRNNEKVVCPKCGGTSLEKLFSVFASGSGSESSSSEGSIPSSTAGKCSPGGCGCGMNMG